MMGPTGIPKWLVLLVGIPYALIHPIKTLEVLRQGWRNRKAGRMICRYQCRKCKTAMEYVTKPGESNRVLLMDCPQCKAFHLFDRVS